jgi:hypothetical protein
VNWFNCLRRRSQKNRRIGWDWFEALTVRFALPTPQTLIPGYQARRDAGDFREEPGAGKPPARICEGKAEWPSYSTANLAFREAGRKRLSPKTMQVISYMIGTCSLWSIASVSLGEHVRQHNRCGGRKRAGLTGEE